MTMYVGRLKHSFLQRMCVLFKPNKRCETTERADDDDYGEVDGPAKKQDGVGGK